MKQDIRYVIADDWCGLYVNGKLAVEGHSLRPTQVLGAVGLDVRVYEADADWIAEMGSLPADFTDVVTS